MRLTFQSELGKILSTQLPNFSPETLQACSHRSRYENFLAQFNTNVFGTIKVTRAILAHLRQRRTGMIIFIGSLSGWIGHAGISAYDGSKFALEGNLSLPVLSIHRVPLTMALRNRNC
jgi:NAD(P)-dependent dehydrogenase (short-subunit alcohol dehydrogenase family)